MSSPWRRLGTGFSETRWSRIAERGVSTATSRQGWRVSSRARKTLVQLAWLWLRYQPESSHAAWFRDRVGSLQGRIRRITIVALARKLLIAIWRFVTLGLAPEGAIIAAYNSAADRSAADSRRSRPSSSLGASVPRFRWVASAGIEASCMRHCGCDQGFHAQRSDRM
jgi:hypothetical protein